MSYTTIYWIQLLKRNIPTFRPIYPLGRQTWPISRNTYKPPLKRRCDSSRGQEMEVSAPGRQREVVMNWGCLADNQQTIRNVYNICIKYIYVQASSVCCPLSATQPRFFFQHLLLELSQSSSPAHVVTTSWPNHRSKASKRPSEKGDKSRRRVAVPTIKAGRRQSLELATSPRCPSKMGLQSEENGWRMSKI